jgi:hypothetical protein
VLREEWEVRREEASRKAREERLATDLCLACEGPLERDDEGGHPLYCELCAGERRALVHAGKPIPRLGPTHCQRPGCKKRLPPPHPHGGRPRFYCPNKCGTLVVRDRTQKIWRGAPPKVIAKTIANPSPRAA